MVRPRIIIVGAGNYKPMPSLYNLLQFLNEPSIIFFFERTLIAVSHMLTVLVCFRDIWLEKLRILPFC